MNPLLLDHQLCFSLYAASRAMTAAYGPMLKELGLTYPQYLAMLVLWETDDVSVKHLGDRLHLDSGTLTPVLGKLEQRGLVTKVRDDADARVVRVSLTTSGRALRKKALEIPEQLLCQFGIKLPAVAQLRKELTALTQNLREANAEETHEEDTP